MKVIDIRHLGSGNVFTWTREYLYSYLTSGKQSVLQTPHIMAAFHEIDRKDFIPNEFKDKAYQDIDIEIGHGEVLTRPSVLAQQIELLRPEKGGTYLDLGTGSGYFSMLLGFIAGPKGKVISIERVQWLWEMARSNSSNYKDINNISFLYRDGTDGLLQYAPYNGIHVSYAMKTIPESLKQQLSPDGGILVVPTHKNDLRVIERNGEDDYTEEIIPGFIFKEGRSGVA
jgi:protein-L-isoaspartate(D-aspartate) O-methyltransferase